jgi:small subunit ribosomal protein S8
MQHTKVPAIRGLERVSRPGLRQYAKPAEIKRVQNGLGIAITVYFKRCHDR